MAANLQTPFFVGLQCNNATELALFCEKAYAGFNCTALAPAIEWMYL